MIFSFFCQKNSFNVSKRFELHNKNHNNNNNNAVNMAIFSGNESASIKKPLVDDQKTGPDKSEAPLCKFKVETNNRFWSVGSKLVTCRKFITEKQAKSQDINRIAFYDKLKRLANCDKPTGSYELSRQLSHEEELWQSELKDLIWLELRARLTDRSITSQDKYLCEERKKICQLLDEIMHFSYKFDRTPSSESSEIDTENVASTDKETIQCWDRSGCLKLFCSRCIEQQNMALRQVEQLMERLEYVESLFPSSRAFAAHYPLYKSSDFTNRVKAMCVWYNITKRQRLMLLILGRHLMKEQEFLEPSSGMNVIASTNCSPSTSNDSGKGSLTPSPEDSVTEKPEFKLKRSSANYREPISYKDLDVYNTQPIATLRQHFFPYSMVPNSDTCDASLTYRQFITGVLKTKGLRKALKFLDSLYKNALRKAHLTLKDPSVTEDETKEPYPHDEELLRYNYWSDESQALNLPSYRAAFIFLSRISLDLIHTYLHMRLDTRPEKPSIMSIRQLTCELKEGLLLAVVHRRRFVRHVQSTLWSDMEKDMKIFEERIYHFDMCSKRVLEVYLGYMEEWVVMMEHCRAQKNILEEEWNDLKVIMPHIPNSRPLVTQTFCQIAKQMLETTAVNFTNNILEHSKIITNVDQSQTKQNVLSVCRELQSVLGLYREKALLVMSLVKTICKDLIEHFRKYEKTDTETYTTNLPPIWLTMKPLKEKVFEVCQRITEVIMSVEQAFNTCNNDNIDDATLAPRVRDVLQQMYKFAFEYHKEANRIACGPFKDQMAMYNMSISKLWINFVHERYERGRGLKPKWANTGLEFLLNVCEPQNIAGLSDDDFKDFKNQIEDCVVYIIGTHDDNSALSNNANPFKKKRSATAIEGMNKIIKTERFSKNDVERSVRVMDAINKLDHKLEEKLRSQDLIGHISTTDYNFERVEYIRPRPVHFSWQRGIKIGQGRFGKVYTAVNNETGELMAMKEIQLQPFDHKAIRNVAVELKIFEGIVHENLVRYYGVEIHREEMVIFMELCAEGTLESLVAATENGLPEGLIRRFTKQLVSGVDVLHQHAIVHRDIKSANIFITAEGNCLKLGDFGSAVKMKAHTTIPGELKGFVGTQAYMAPEVFMKSNTEGHGRAADIWSIGCVVIEMASGKRPWSEYDSNYQIMFKVGMGASPTIPDTLSTEGQEFIEFCLQHDPCSRATTADLLDDNFIKVMPEDCVSCRISSITMLEESLKLGLRR
ncbi:mitogen-activated protein kinase kinase kinase 4 isoform X2 [Adelges cooleyi]|uniref:mitogen-activated protein kinase kinase kinase 4 isoform X2 n=1 Tax=Adelges cooleyi TaxID=133065 RepID=UPI00217FE8E5|nr:mitogen-activated protein kinase kinase kinase 4 isoform X2 [Adelges cooleyi]